MSKPGIFFSRLGSVLGVAFSLLLAGRLEANQDRARDLSVVRMDTGQALDGRGKQWSVIIGVSKYKNVPATAQLRFAHRDAIDFARFLSSPNGGGFPSSQIRVLQNEEATLAAIRTALGTWLPRSAEPDDLIFIFFAGHGTVENEHDGYLLAHDSDPQNLYATALSIAELNSIVSQRLRARNVILIADACHSGSIGWTSRGTERQVLITRYLEELGKSGAGVFKLMASRADERSYEDEKWGGGHGVFTHFLLEGLRGKADRDGDQVVRAAELVDYLSQVVPEQTLAMQHPRVAGNLDARLPLSVLSTGPAPAAKTTALPPQLLSLEIRGRADSEIYLNKSYRGKIRPDGTLIVEGLAPGAHELAVDSAGTEPFSQTIQLSAAKTILNLKPANASTPNLQTSPLTAKIQQALKQERILGAEGAWQLYQKLVKESPGDPARVSLETDLVRGLEDIGQRAINGYIRSAPLLMRKSTFREAAEAFQALKTLRPSDTQIEAKQLFCEGRALIEENNIREALPILKRAIQADPKAAYAYNALGLAQERSNDTQPAMEAFAKAVELAPQWPVPQVHIAILKHQTGQWAEAEKRYRAVLDLAPQDVVARMGLIRLLRERQRWTEAEQEALSLKNQAPDYAQVYLELGLIDEALKQPQKAVEAFERYLALAPNTADRAVIQAMVDKNKTLSERKRPTLKGIQ